MSRDDDCLTEITVAGAFDPDWSSWLDGAVEPAGSDASPVTVITGSMDQATLRGVLNRLWDLNLSLISVVRRDTPPTGATPRHGQEDDPCMLTR